MNFSVHPYIVTRQAVKGLRFIKLAPFHLYLDSKSTPAQLCLVSNCRFLDQFIYIGSNISLTESNVNIYIGKEMNTATRVQILDETDCISHSTNTLGKGMNPIILPPAMGK